MKKNPYEPTDSDLEQVVDEARKDLGLGPARRTPEKGIKDMDARIRELTALRKKLLDRFEEASTPRKQKPIYAALLENKQQLAEARARKREYAHLLDASN